MKDLLSDIGGDVIPTSIFTRCFCSVWRGEAVEWDGILSS